MSWAAVSDNDGPAVRGQYLVFPSLTFPRSYCVIDWSPQVGNLPWDMTAEGLKNVFILYDPYDVHIKTNMSGRSRGE